MLQLEDLREKVKEELGNVDCFIGYGEGFDALHATPLFVKTPEMAEKLVWNPLCVHNLTTYLTQATGKVGIIKVGIIVKGCDSRAIVQLLQENLLKRENLVIIGIPCQGVIDLNKVKKHLNISNVKEVSFSDETIKIVTEQEEKSLNFKDVMADKCLSCQFPTPLIYDHLIGESVTSDKPADSVYSDVAEFENKSIEERFEFWNKEFARCIRCYACRNACPLCVCQDQCAAETRDPHWMTMRVNVTENSTFHLMRALHLAGRCVGCGECERACPMNIPLTKIFKKMSQVVEELFDYKAGIEVEGTAPLLTFKVEEPTIHEG